MITFPTTFNFISESINFLLLLANELPVVSTFPTICIFFSEIFRKHLHCLLRANEVGTQGFLYKVPSTAPLGSVFLLRNYVLRESSQIGFINLFPWLDFRVSLCSLALCTQFCTWRIFERVLNSSCHTLVCTEYPVRLLNRFHQRLQKKGWESLLEWVTPRNILGIGTQANTAVTSSSQRPCW